MQSSRDSSVWRTLAVAFGDGLAFGVGVHLTQSAARRAIAENTARRAIAENTARRAIPEGAARRAVAETAPSEFHPRVTGIQPPAQPRLEPAASSSAVLNLIDGRFREVGGQIDRRLAELEVKFQIALTDLNAGVRNELDTHSQSSATNSEARIEALRAELSALLAEQRRTASDELRTLRSQMITVQKEFAETLSRLVDEQISKTIADRLEPLEARLQQSLREELRVAAETTSVAAQQAFDARLQTLQDALAAKDRQLGDLRRLLEEHDRTVLDLVVSLGHSCLQAAERISVPVSARPVEPAPPAAPEAPAPDPDLPGFAQQPPAKALWRLPIVSSFLMATCGLLLLHYI